MKRSTEDKRSTAGACGQPAEMSLELQALRIAAAIEQLERVIERAIRRKYGIPG